MSRAVDSKWTRMLSDTHPDAEAVQQELLRQMSEGDKFALVQSLTATVVGLCKQGIRDRHPECDEQEVNIVGILNQQHNRLDMAYLSEWADRLQVHDLWDRVQTPASPGG